MADRKTAIVTGASKGIGAAVAERLAADGFGVIVNYAHSKDAAQQVVDGIAGAGGSARSVQADIGNPEAITHLFDAAEEAFGPVDVLVNNAGIMSLQTIADTDDATFDRHVATNLAGVFFGLREGARRVRDGGRIISFSSSVVGLYPERYGIYAATKAAVEAMTHVLAKELGSRGVSVNVVAPGPVSTDLFLSGKSQEMIDGMKARIPLGRLGEVDDIAGVVSFLAGPDSGWINGQVVRANGGVI